MSYFTKVGIGFHFAACAEEEYKKNLPSRTKTFFLKQESCCQNVEVDDQLCLSHLRPCYVFIVVVGVDDSQLCVVFLDWTLVVADVIEEAD